MSAYPDTGSSADDWSRADDIFSAVLELPPAQRDTAMEERCAGDATLKATVRRLLQAEERSRRLFASVTASVQALAEQALRSWEETESSTEGVDQIGPYRLVECLGRGGMSIVWKGERNDGEFQQTVAVKLLRRWIDNDESVRRFREERRILATLEHPNLARLLDGGVAADGWPYFVMEYVDGMPITDYCDRRALGVEGRLALFMQILKVVQYAHQRLIVHRDLKPSNILVTEAGQVKLLDFGIARVLDTEAEAAAVSEFTQAGGRLLTPAYASPEQLCGQRISTAADIYGLGVLLYRLLTGRSPYCVPDGQPGLLQHAVLTQVPSNPSARVLDAGEADEDPAQLARLRDTTPAGLARVLRGDIDAICQVALRKEPERRYSSVEQLVADIDRYRQRLPVLARAGNRRYRTLRFLRRHALAVSAAVGVPLLMVVALVLHVERLGTERDRAAASAMLAEHEAEKARQVSEYLVGLFRAADPGESGGREVTAVELVERGIERTQAIDEDPSLRASMLHVLGQVSRTLGRYQQADGVLAQALGALDLAPEASGIQRADVLAELGEANFQLGRLDVAESYHRQALAALPANELSRRARVLTNLGIVSVVTSRYEEAEEQLEQALDLHRRTASHSVAYATTLNALGTLLSRQERHREAVEMLNQALSMRRDLLGDRHPATSVARGNLGIVLLEAGDAAAGEVHMLEALVVDEQVLGETHPSLAILLNQIASARRELGDPRGAIAYLSRALDILRGHHDPESPAIGVALSGLGTAHLRLGEFDTAATFLAQAAVIDERALGPGSRELAIDLVSLAGARLGQARYDDAEVLVQRALPIAKALLGERHQLVGHALRYRSVLHWHRGNVSQSIGDGEQSLRILENSHGSEHSQVVALRDWLSALTSGDIARPPPEFQLL